jgi:hypothetical protein
MCKAKKLRGKEPSVHYGCTKRFDKAEDQFKILPKELDKKIELVNEALVLLGIDEVTNPKYTNFTVMSDKRIKIDYRHIAQQYGLNSEKHLIWMKDTKSGHTGVVAASNDCNFDIPSNEGDYNCTTDGKCKNRNNKWKYNTSGIIIHKLGQVWNEDFILLFPLKGICDESLGDIECGIGEYLISKGTPILDYYSHTF